MKQALHPKVNPVIFRDKEGATDYFVTSTLTSETTEEHGGVTYYVINVEVSAATHPFYTGKQKLIDTAGKADKFRARVAKAETAPEKVVVIKDSVKRAAGKHTAAASAVDSKKLVGKLKSDKTKREAAAAALEEGSKKDKDAKKEEAAA